MLAEYINFGYMNSGNLNSGNILMNKHDQALETIINLSKRMKIEIKELEIIVYKNERINEVDLEVLERSVKDLGAIQMQKLILFLDSKKVEC